VKEIPKTNYFFVSPIRETSKFIGNNDKDNYNEVMIVIIILVDDNDGR